MAYFAVQPVVYLVAWILLHVKGARENRAFTYYKYTHLIKHLYILYFLCSHFFVLYMFALLKKYSKFIFRHILDKKNLLTCRFFVVLFFTYLIDLHQMHLSQIHNPSHPPTNHCGLIIHIPSLSSPLLLRNYPNTFAFIPLVVICLSSLNRSNSKAFCLILPCVAPVCEGMHYHKTGVP